MHHWQSAIPASLCDQRHHWNAGGRVASERSAVAIRMNAHQRIDAALEKAMHQLVEMIALSLRRRDEKAVADLIKTRRHRSQEFHAKHAGEVVIDHPDG